MSTHCYWTLYIYIWPFPFCICKGIFKGADTTERFARCVFSCSFAQVCGELNCFGCLDLYSWQMDLYCCVRTNILWKWICFSGTWTYNVLTLISIWCLNLYFWEKGSWAWVVPGSKWDPGPNWAGTKLDLGPNRVGPKLDSGQNGLGPNRTLTQNSSVVALPETIGQGSKIDMAIYIYVYIYNIVYNI